MSLDYSIVLTEQELNEALAEIAKTPRNDMFEPLVLDLETYPNPEIQFNQTLNDGAAADRFTVQICGISISWKEEQAIYIPLAHQVGKNFQFDTIVDATEAELLRRLNPFLTQWTWSNHLERYDWGILKQRGHFINYKLCSYIAAVLTGKYVDLFRGEQGGSDAGLKRIVFREFGYQMREFEEIAKYSDGYHIERVDSEQAALYACDDANWARKLIKFLYPQVKDMFLWKVEMRLSHIVEVMEENGVPFNPAVCAEQLLRLQEFRPQAAEIIFSQIEKQLGHRINFDIGNVSQVRGILFDQPPRGLGLPVQRKSKKTGVPSTDAKVLERLSKDFQVVHNILTYRKLDKSESSFLTTLPEWVHPLTKKIHSTFHQGGVPTGRFANSAPNTQNLAKPVTWAIKDGENSYTLTVNLRNSIEVDEDELIVLADYKQVEFWGACELAHEDGMLDSMAKGYDPHTATGARMYNFPIDAVPDEFRKKAKTRNFAFLYGEVVESAAAKEGVSIEEMRVQFEKHEQALPRVMSHRKQVIAAARRDKKVFTYFGLPVLLDQLYDHPDRRVQEKGDRFAYNALIQGTFSGELPKIAMVRCNDVFRSDYPIYPDGTVQMPIFHNGHDSLAFRLTPKVRGDVSTMDLSGFVSKLRDAMVIQLPSFKLPARIDIEVGRRFGSLIKYKGQSVEEVFAELRGKEVEKTVIDDKTVKPTVIKLQLDGTPTNEQAVALKALLVQYPGNNLVILEFQVELGGKHESLVLRKLPTSLTLKDADKFAMIFQCRVLAENVEEHMDYMVQAMDNL